MENFYFVKKILKQTEATDNSYLSNPFCTDVRFCQNIGEHRSFKTCILVYFMQC